MKGRSEGGGVGGRGRGGGRGGRGVYECFTLDG